jgi:transcriptional regulator with XRE-family HTH domain
VPVNTTGDRVFAEAFGISVREARRRLRLSQEALGELCHLDRTYISGVERGVRNPTVLSIWRIANALQVLPSELLREAERAVSAKGSASCRIR